ncbi:hypothetical protein [Pseudoroseicyclus aestuarii]|uniref:Uncharacterized protein n=1 Tax=Pseudoroseicyclus aestuarii TaxID=1795041 RepID=A0A318SNE6_9RHOB|nr:hypothetical protein [Pseudoroseicyclus aestuarii]PYE81392.1 hypothetical protein DFP88_10671 [Pseudoroseicyclus aestuarii]
MPYRFPLAALGLALLLGCAPGLPVQPDEPADLPLQPGQVRAYFTDLPSTLLDAVRAGCTGPQAQVTRPGALGAGCESLPPPELAAALILDLGGTVEDLPRLVTNLRAVEASGRGGYVVTAENLIRVPQRDGGPAQLVRPDSPQLKGSMRALLEAAGGEVMENTEKG